jgi:lipopolysaccharide transport system ATP-binding protein
VTQWAVATDKIGKCYRISDRARPNSFVGAVSDTFGIGDKKRSKATQEFWALRNVSFEVGIGKRLGIVGANGAGKSTLLKILSRITAPTEGEARLRGRVASLLEVGTGFHPELTGRENIYLNGTILGLSRNDIKKAFDAIVDYSGVEAFIDTPIKHYSSGMHVRLAFSVAVQLEPDIMIIDEVLAVGDAAFQKKCQRTIDNAAREGRTILLVSHSMSSVKKMCDDAILLEHGTIKSYGRTQDVVEEYVAETESIDISEAAVEEFPDNWKKPAVVRRVAVIDEAGTPNRVYGLNDAPAIEIDYHIKEPLESVSVMVAVSRDGTYVFQTHDTDLDASLLKAREPGFFRARIPLPRRFLTAGIYSISVKVAIGNYGEGGEDHVIDAVSFVLSETDQGPEIEFKGWAKARGNFVIVEPKWATRALDSI